MKVDAQGRKIERREVVEGTCLGCGHHKLSYSNNGNCKCTKCGKRQ